MLSKSQAAGRKQAGSVCHSRLWFIEFIDAEVEYLFSRVMFDWTCQFGTNTARPLFLILWFWLVFAFVYFIWLHSSRNSALYRVYSETTNGNRNNDDARSEVVTAAREASSEGRKIGRLFVRKLSLFRACMGFSLFTTFNLSFKELDFGRWLHLLTRKEYAYKPIGWLRVVAGFQSLISFYLLIMAVLSYFGEQFKINDEARKSKRSCSFRYRSCC